MYVYIYPYVHIHTHVRIRAHHIGRNMLDEIFSEVEIPETVTSAELWRKLCDVVVVEIDLLFVFMHARYIGDAKICKSYKMVYKHASTCVYICIYI